MRLTLLSLCIAAFLTACGTPPETMDAMATDVVAHVAELDTEFSNHVTQAKSATSLSALATLDASHRTAVLTLLTSLDEMVEHMGTCMDDKKAAPDTMACKDALSKVRAAAEGHATQVAGKAGLTEAHEEESRHHTELETQLSLLTTQGANFKSMAMKYRCSAGAMSGH